MKQIFIQIAARVKMGWLYFWGGAIKESCKRGNVGKYIEFLQAIEHVLSIRNYN